MEEDLYDENTPFYDDELAMRELAARQSYMDKMQLDHPDPDRVLKRKVIYVYEKDTKSQNPYQDSRRSNLAKVGSQMIYPSSRASFTSS